MSADEPRTAVVELSRPVTKGEQIEYRIKVQLGCRPDSFGTAYLFIDKCGLMQIVAYGA